MEEEAPIVRILNARLNPLPTTDPSILSRILEGVAREIFLEEKYAETRARSARALAAVARKRARNQPTLDDWLIQ
jgi:hypothetical protein